MGESNQKATEKLSRFFVIALSQYLMFAPKTQHYEEIKQQDILLLRL